MSFALLYVANYLYRLFTSTVDAEILLAAWPFGASERWLEESDQEEDEESMGCAASNNANGAKVSAIEVLEEHDGAVNNMAISDDGSLLVTGSEDNTIRMWSTRTPNVECIGVLEGHTSYITCCTVADTFVITGSADNTIRKWCMTKCECMHIYQGHSSRICRLICTGEFIFSSSYDKTAKAWFFDAEDIAANRNKANGDCIKTFVGHQKGVYPLIFIPAEGIPSESFPGRLNINPGDLLITGSADCTAKAWSFDTADCLKTFEGHTSPITCMATDGTGKTLFTGSGDCIIRSWHIGKGECLRELRGHENPIITIQVVNRLLYSGSSDMTARCWVSEFGDCTRVYRGHKNSVTCLRVFNGVLYTGSSDNSVRAYDARSGVVKRIFKGHDNGISTLVAMENRLYTGSVDGSLRVWDTSGIADELLTGTSVQMQTGKKALTEKAPKIEPPPAEQSQPAR